VIKNILVSVSGSLNSLAAAKYAICLAALLKAKLFIVYVIDIKVLAELLKSRIFVEAEARTYEQDLEQQGTVFLERTRKMAEAKLVPCETFLLRGSIADEIIKKCQEVPADLLVVGELRELTSRADVFYEEPERMIRKAPCPVVMAKNQAMIDVLYKETV
jgi:nucleotide-binding universal stress UspA family protein